MARPATDGGPSATAKMADDGRTFTVTAPGIAEFQAGWNATIRRGGKQKVLSSSEGAASRGAVTTVRFPSEDVELLFRLEPAPGGVGVLAQAGIHNGGTASVDLVSLTPLVARSFRVHGAPAEWLVTRLSTTAMAGGSVVRLASIDGVLDVRECGGFYRQDGTGFLFGPVGEPIAYVKTRFWRRQDEDNRLTIMMDALMSGVCVEPGETRWGQQVGLLMEQPRQALARWAEWVAQSHGARTGKGSVWGWNSWHTLAQEVSGSDILAVVNASREAPDRLRPAVIQIDDGYQDLNGESGTNDRFPEGLPFYAQRIATTGARPGLYLSLMEDPRRSLKTEAQTRRVERAVRDGFTYLKVLLRPCDKAEGKRTALEASRDMAMEIRRAAGDDAYLLSCNNEPDRAMVGAFDASRTGANAHRNSIGTTIVDVLRSYHLHNRWFAVDNDGYYLGTDIANVSQIQGGWPFVRTWTSMVGLSCGAAITSDPWQLESFRPYWRNVEIMTPPAGERTEVLDLCTSEEWPRLVGRVSRPWGDYVVSLLWNPRSTEEVVQLDFARAGMDPGRRYAVWSFWDDRYLGVAEGSWTTPKLGSMASQHLRFTELDRSSSWPVLIGSDLHIYCGAAEVKTVRRSYSGMEIELTDAGARDGALFVYSPHQPILKSAVGCIVDDIPSAGENVWRINLHDRRSGTPQRIEVALVLPVTYQSWFWLLIATVIGSLLFGSWRYVVGLRLERANALERERARIAQDLHDDLGTSLTRISAMADTAAGESHDPVRARSGFVAIRDVACDMTRAMDEIVWAISPARDSLESLADFFGGYAQRLLTEPGLRCRLQFPLRLPEWRLSAETRHSLLLAYKEALNNVLKHARATEVTVGLTVTAAGFVLFVGDNGRGMPADESAAGRTGNGLRNMRDRLARLKGSCRILAGTAGGTRVEFEVPAATGR
jgi:alpha-galactosidase